MKRRSASPTERSASSERPAARPDLKVYRSNTSAGKTSPAKRKKSILRQICRKAVMAFRGICRAVQRAWSGLLNWMQSRSRSVQYLLCTVPILVLLLVLIAVIAMRNSRKTSVAMSESEQAVIESYDAGEEGNGTVFNSSEESVPEENTEQFESESEQVVEEAEGYPAFEGQIEEGYTGEIVSEIQARLMELGYMDPDETTQYYGPLTKSSLRTFQLHNGLEHDGICGEQTYSLLMSKDAKIYVMQEGDSGVDVEEVQHRLYELGYLDNKANITGKFGEKTTEAAKMFQKKNKLTVDGKIGEKSLSMMYDEDVVGNAFKIGDEAPVIKQCQEKLYKLGYISSKSNVKGVFNKTTRSAIKSFQRANGLTVDGALGPLTRDAILSDAASGKSLKVGDSGSDVKNAQKRLIALNYLKSGNDSGYYGDLTAAAVKEFQKKNHLTADGILNTYTLKKLNSSSARKASTPVTKPA
ncbi:MAG: peptidoglycan-binding protein, partial [Clostridia bacterium]|nr:peptidoglycan-binding protein [Clostridia bacterium]